MFFKKVNIERKSINWPIYNTFLDYENKLLIKFKSWISYERAEEFIVRYKKALKEEKVLLLSQDITIEKI